jgi:hypothetical protein
MDGASVSRRRCITRLAGALVAALIGAVPAQAQVADEAAVKAAFVYNFLKFVEWPADTAHGPRDAFVLLIVGGSATADATERLLRSKQLGERPILVRRVAWDQAVAGVDAAFVAEHDVKKLRHVLDAVGTAHILTIGEGEDFATLGGMIGLLVEERRVRFDIDTRAVDAAGLRVSSKLLALTRIVRTATDSSGKQP